ncbi:hypothetical protein M3Y95_00140800 [Aphelenchoides besseyi]|nr:hypothetical protein M3Y95_00140800 [Aphelenchoides besseyi]
MDARIQSATKGFLIGQFESTNRFSNHLLDIVELSLIEELPNEKEKIVEVVERFRNPCESSFPLLNSNSKSIKLPVSIQIREKDVEKRHGVYAISVDGDVGVKNLERESRNVVQLPVDFDLVEVRKFEEDLNCYCTIPKLLQATEYIVKGAKYELVFEKKSTVGLPPQGSQLLLRQSSSMDFLPSALSLNSREASLICPQSSTHSPMDEALQEFTPENGLLDRLFSRDTNESGTFDSTSLDPSVVWSNREEESMRLLPEFDVVELFHRSQQGRSIFEHLIAHSMSKSKSRIRVLFVQILGKFFLDELRPKLTTPVTAALRRAFIERVYRDLAPILKPLPPKTDFSNRLGNGWFDVYLKHQNAREKKFSRKYQTGVTAEIRQTDEMESDLQLHPFDPTSFIFTNEPSPSSPISLSPDDHRIKPELQ